MFIKIVRLQNTARRGHDFWVVVKRTKWYMQVSVRATVTCPVFFLSFFALTTCLDWNEQKLSDDLTLKLKQFCYILCTFYCFLHVKVKLGKDGGLFYLISVKLNMCV